MKKLTIKMLKEKNACKEGIDFCKQQNTDDFKELFDAFIKYKRYDYVSWVFRRFMNKKQSVMYAIFAAEQVIDIFENKYPEDDRPRKAIEAAKEYLKDPCKETIKIADAAADAAIYTSIYTAAADAADAAADAAAADAAAASAGYAGYAAAYAASATAAYAARKDIKVEILRYGFELLTGETK